MSYILNIDNTYTDNVGNQLLLSNNIVATAYYDASSESSWTRSYTGVLDIPDLVASGTLYGGWSDSSVSSMDGNFSVCANYALLDRQGDLIREHSVTTSQSSYYTWSHRSLMLTKWFRLYNEGDYTQTPWLTKTDSGWAKFDLGESRDFNSVYLKWAGSQGSFSGAAEITNSPKDYMVEASNDNVVYTTVISGSTTTSGEISPIYQDVGDRSYRYIKVSILNNWGGLRVGLSEFGVFNKPLLSAVMLYPNDFKDTVATEYAELSNTVDLTGIGSIYTDIGGYFYADDADSYFKVLIDSDVVFDSENPQQSTGRWSFWQARSTIIDTSSYSGQHTIRFRFRGATTDNNSYRAYAYSWVSRCSFFPSWYDEGFSENRGAKSAFPEKVVVISDSTALSIIDVTSVSPATGLPESPSLWMRFVYHRDNAIPLAPSNIVCVNGKIFLTTVVGLYVLDFNNDRIDKYTESGLFRLSGIKNRHYGTTGADIENVHLAAPYWETISTAEEHKLRDIALECLAVIPDVQTSGDDFVVFGGMAGAEALVSGTLYSSKFRNKISAISKTDAGEVAFAGGRDGFARVGIMYDFSNVGANDFDVDYVLHQSNPDFFESFNGSYDASEVLIDSGHQLDITTSGTYAVISGSVDSLDQLDQRAVMLLSKGAADRPFKAQAYVRLRQWPDAAPGELRFGVFNKEPAASINADVENVRGMYMSARNSNSPPGPVYSDDFLDGADNFYNVSRGSPTSSWGNSQQPTTQYNVGIGFGARYNYTVSADKAYYSHNSVYNNSFILRVKIRPYQFRLKASDPSPSAFFRMGLSNIGEGSSSIQSLLCFEAIRSNTYQQGIYRISRYSSSSWEYSSTDLPFFAEDNTVESSLWRDVVIYYDNTTMSMSAYVDGYFVGTKDIPFWYHDAAHIYMWWCSEAPAYSTTGIICMVKNFSIDFPSSDYSVDNRKYAVCCKAGAALGTATTGFCYSEYLWGMADSPYVASVETVFSGTEGTTEEPFRKWELFYNPQHSSISSYIDGVHIGSTNLTYTDSKFEDMSIGFDVQFYPPTTISGRDVLEVHIRDFSVTYSGTEQNHLYSDSAVFQPILSGGLQDADISSTSLDSSVDINVAVGTSAGVSKICVNKPQNLLEYAFSGASVPSAWSVKDMPGATGSSSWTVASGVLKQSDSIYGHGDVVEPLSLYGAFGTHLLTDISCARQNEDSYAVGKTITTRLRTTLSGCVGLGFNEVWETVGTVTSGSGYYCAWYNNSLNIGRFESIYDSVGPTYDSFFSVDGSLLVSDVSVADIGIPRSISLNFTSTSGIDVYVDSSRVFAVVNADVSRQQGYLSFICNNNTNLDIFDCSVYSNDTVAQETVSYSIVSGASDYPVLQGSSAAVVSVIQDTDFSRSSGLLHAGTSSQVYKWTRLPDVKNTIYDAEVWLTFFYEEEHDRLLGAVSSANGGVYAAGNPRSSFHSCPVQYNFSTNTWRFAGELSSSLSISSIYGVSTNWASPFERRAERDSDPGPGQPRFVCCPNLSVAYVITSAVAVTKYYVNSKETDIRGNRVAYGDSYQVEGSLNAMGYGDRDDGFYYLSGAGGSHCPYFGVPTFSWYDGFVYVARDFDYFAWEHKGQAFWILDPVSGNWALDHSGAMSVNGIVHHNPPVGSTSAEDSLVKDDRNQAFAYCETNDSVYSLRNDTFYRLDLPTNSWHLLEAPPFTVDSEIYWKALTIEVVPELNSIFVLNGNDGILYVYDVASDTWVSKFTVPGGTSYHTHMLHVPSKSNLYLYTGATTNRFLELSLPTIKGISYDTTSLDAGRLPTSSKYGMFSWRGPDTSVVDEAFDYDNLDFAHWFTTASGGGAFADPPNPWRNGGYVSETPDTNLATRVSCRTKNHYEGNYAKFGGVSSRVSVPASSFTASLDVRNPQIDHGGSEIYSVFGIGQGTVACGVGADGIGPPSRHFSRGCSGVYACAFDSSTYSHRYSLVKRDGSTTTSLVSSDYILAASEDGGWDSPFRTWTISYNADSGLFSFSIDGTSVGSITLSAPLDEMFIEIGILWEAAEDIWTTVEFQNFTIDFNSGISETVLQSGTNKLVITKNQEYNADYYYERTLSTLTPSESFIYETQTDITSATVVDCPYVLSLGRLRDGSKEINLCVLLDGEVRKIGLWNGDNPWSVAEGFDSAVEVDWSSDTVYRIIKDLGSDNVLVYADDLVTPVITKAYSSFPDVHHSYERSVSFGNIGLASSPVEVLDASFHEGYGTTVSGMSWTRLEQNAGDSTFRNANHSWFGSVVYATTDFGNTEDYVEWTPAVASGTKHLYYCPGRNLSNNSTNAPYTVYHTGAAIDLPSYDSYATNNITSVQTGTTHSGTVAVGATTIDVSDNRLANGKASVNKVFPGFVYLGTYTGITSIVATRDASDGTNVYPGTMFFYDYAKNDRLKSLSTSEWSYVKCEPGSTSFTADTKLMVGGVNIVDTSANTIIDYYSSSSDPAILGDNTSDISKM